MKKTFYKLMFVMTMLSGLCQSRMEAQLITNIKLNPQEDLTLQTEKTQFLSVNVTPVDAANKNLKWESSDPGKVRITRSDNSGAYLKAEGVGEATIKVTAQDGSNVSASITVTVVRLIEKIVLVSPGPLKTGAKFIVINEIVPANATNRELLWDSSAPDVVSVAGGLITTHKLGTAVITATSQDGSYITESITIRVIQPVTKVTIDGGDFVLKETQSKQLTATVSPNDAPIRTVRWLSNNTTVATVDRNGFLRAKAPGETTITATSEDPDAEYPSDEIKITVVPYEIAPPPVNKQVTNVSISEGDQNLTVNEEIQLTAVITPADATNPKVIWSSSKHSVATVSSTGLLKAVGAGEATVKVTSEDQGKTAQITVRVRAGVISVTDVTLNKTAVNLSIGGKERLTAIVTPSDATNRKVTWSSNNDAVATVDHSGEITAHQSGEAVITVTTQDGGKTAQATVKVVSVNTPVTDIKLNKTTVNLSIGGKERLLATIAPMDATNRNVTWSSDNDAVATVDHSGEITAHQSGEAVITVTTQDGGKTAMCKVTVEKKKDVSNELVDREIAVWSNYGRLYVNSPEEENIEIYALTGVKLYRITKPAGETVFYFNLPKGILIVKGASGWVRKVKL